MTTSPHILATILLGLAVASEAEEFGGVEFPAGSISFADRLVSYEPLFFGGPGPTNPKYTDPTAALGAPDYPGGDNQFGSVSLGRGGRITLQFTNNVLTGSDDPAPDLYIFEVGSDFEDMFVEISEDGKIWHFVGKANATREWVDIDLYGFGSDTAFRYVRLSDDPYEGNNTTSTVGADLDCVGATNTVPVIEAPHVTITESHSLTFFAELGSRYVIEESTSLRTWESPNPPFTGSGSAYNMSLLPLDGRRFFRVRTLEE
ncbi:hypothetical protein [Haloferula sp.]|uniref:hypothetical protein n=1 Tax=Haloferula sp. TaxID=2497595 RepID=UPI0032A0366F